MQLTRALMIFCFPVLGFTFCTSFLTIVINLFTNDLPQIVDPDIVVKEVNLDNTGQEQTVVITFPKGTTYYNCQMAAQQHPGFNNLKKMHFSKITSAGITFNIPLPSNPLFIYQDLVYDMVCANGISMPLPVKIPVDKLVTFKKNSFQDIFFGKYVVLVGLPGTGKSTTGTHFMALTSGSPYIDLSYFLIGGGSAHMTLSPRCYRMRSTDTSYPFLFSSGHLICDTKGFDNFTLNEVFEHIKNICKGVLGFNDLGSDKLIERTRQPDGYFVTIAINEALTSNEKNFYKDVIHYLKMIDKPFIPILTRANRADLDYYLTTGKLPKSVISLLNTIGASVDSAVLTDIYHQGDNFRNATIEGPYLKAMTKMFTLIDNTENSAHRESLSLFYRCVRAIAETIYDTIFDNKIMFALLMLSAAYLFKKAATIQLASQIVSYFYMMIQTVKTLAKKVLQLRIHVGVAPNKTLEQAATVNDSNVITSNIDVCNTVPVVTPQVQTLTESH